MTKQIHISGKITEDELLEMCSENVGKTLIGTIQYGDSLIVIGIKLGQNTPYMIVGNMNNVDIESVEDMLRLK